MADNKIKFNDQKTDALVICKKASLRKLEDLPLVIGDASNHSISLHPQSWCYHRLSPHHAAVNQHDMQKFL
jgi:hypothetical protein